MSSRDDLRKLIVDLAVVHGRVVLSSGREADYYVDLRRVTLHHEAAPLVGEVMLDTVADWQFDAVGGLTLGADPVATAMMHAAAARGQAVDAFVVRKTEKAHGLQRRVEGPNVGGRRVVVHGVGDDGDAACPEAGIGGGAAILSGTVSAGQCHPCRHNHVVAAA